MRKAILSLVLAIVATVAVQAQQIAVVSAGGTTTIYKTLPEAVAGASAGSTVYLPGGGFTLTDTLRITKKLTLVGVGYNITGGNADGVTTISGNIAFNKGSSGSAIMGVYMPGASGKGYIYIGKDGSAVEDIVVKYCWVYRIEINNSQCIDAVINQNYVSYIHLGYSEATVTNNVIYYISYGDGAEIKYNVFCGSSNSPYYCRNCVISNNVICGSVYESGSSQFRDNIGSGSNSYYESIGTSKWADVFVNYGSSPDPRYDYHFKEAYQQYEGKVGIYAGSGFNDSGMPPVPYISYKYIPDHTDADGNLNIKIRVKASE